ncbi:MAG: hypothetical protein OJI67_04070 [Prosthecobacter sp.]|nr:hypothetical protein [Prosthecobacter sp.]
MKTTLFILSLAAFTSLSASDAIETVMKEAMKGDASLYKKVATGKGTPEDATKLLEYVKALPAESPPEGSAASWKEKTATLVAAAQDVAAGKSGATAVLQKAGNCKACHSEHKGK